MRTLISDVLKEVGNEVTIMGWVDVRRDQGKMVFIELRDRSGQVQCVVLPQSEALGDAHQLRPEWVIAVTGVVNKRPAKNAREGDPLGALEVEIKKIEVITKAHELPFEKDTEVNLDTLLDNRPLTLRAARERDIFKVQATLLDAYRQSLIRQGFTEFIAPALVGGDAEGGASVFRVKYFDDKIVNLATSPQLYKQIMVGAFERAFTIAKIFRAEKSATTRHLSEITQMDYEMGFINDERDVMAVLETVVKDATRAVIDTHPGVFERFKTTAPAVSESFPILTLAEAQQTIGASPEPDMTPEHERAICEWALKEKGSDFVFITRFPTASRAFYTYEDPNEAPLSRGFDLLFRGLEINSGAQRIHDYDEMVSRIVARGMDPAKFGFYLQAFKYGMPPHGGCSTGLERFTMKMLGLPNVKEAVAFPRDMNRIDTLLSND